MSHPSPSTLLVSPPSRESRKQEYRVYPDRVELEFRFGPRFRMVIPAETIRDVRVSSYRKASDIDPSAEPRLSRLWVLNLDWAAFHRHVLLHVDRWYGPYLRLTPAGSGGLRRGRAVHPPGGGRSIQLISPA